MKTKLTILAFLTAATATAAQAAGLAAGLAAHRVADPDSAPLAVARNGDIGRGHSRYSISQARSLLLFPPHNPPPCPLGLGCEGEYTFGVPNGPYSLADTTGTARKSASHA